MGSPVGGGAGVEPFLCIAMSSFLLSPLLGRFYAAQ